MDLAAVRRLDASDQVGESRLAATAAADQGDVFFLGNV